MKRLSTILLALLLAAPGWGATWYIATNGTDPSSGGCDGGSEAAPWKTWRVPKGLGCIGPGDTIYFKTGTYTSDNTDGIWEQTGSLKHRITWPGSPQTTISAAPGLARGAVKFKAPIEMVGSYGKIEGVEIYADANIMDASGQKTLLSNWASQMVIQGNYIHGSAADVSYGSLPANSYDCLKLEDGIATGVRPDYVWVLDNEVGYCSEQALDMVGSKNVTVERNYFHHAWSISMKGGSEAVSYRRNLHFWMRYGVQGGSMGCTGAYCGSPDLEAVAFADRYVAKDIDFSSNQFVSVQYNAIGNYGWMNADIYNNSISPGTSQPVESGTSALYVGRSGADFYDVIAAAWCGDNPGECTECGDGCYRYLKFAPVNCNFKNNVVVVSWMAAQHEIASDAMGMTYGNNAYYRSGTSNIFNDGDTTRSFAYWRDTLSYETETSINTDPLFVSSTDLRPQAASPLIAAGADVGITTDFFGAARLSNDIGAVRYFPRGHTTRARNL